MPYLFVWLYLMKCVFTCSIFVNSSTKRFLSVLGIFGKYFVWKIWNFQKSSFALFWRLSRGYVKSRASVASSRVLLATCSRVEGPVARVTQRFSRLSSRLTGDSLVGKCFSRKIWNFMFFTTQVGDLFAGGRSSHEGYTEIFVAQFATLSRVELPVAKNT